ncbi:MAG: hypothetical protein ACKOPN_13345, partial [Prochlorococcaceae cyanobacterium]
SLASLGNTENSSLPAPMNDGSAPKRSSSQRSTGERASRQGNRSAGGAGEGSRRGRLLRQSLTSVRSRVRQLKGNLDQRLSRLRAEGEAGTAAPASAGGKPRRRLDVPTPSPLLIGALLLVLSGVYFFGVGRNRYQVVSDFIIRQPDVPTGATAGLLGPVAVGPTMMGSIEDGRFLAVYLASPQVMRRVFMKLDPQESYAWRGPDPFAGIGNPASRWINSLLGRQFNFDSELNFFRRQVQVWPQELTGVIQLTTTGLDPKTAYLLNRYLMEEARSFLNSTNQSISREQQQFAEQEVNVSRQRLKVAQANLTTFQNRYGLIAPANEAQAASSYITAMESKLVDLKVQEATLKRQFKDPQSPEVVFVTDQVAEMQRQIAQERAQQVAPKGKDVNKRLAEGQQLQNEVAFATTQLTAAQQAATNSRQRSTMILKFIVTLSEPTVPEQDVLDWRVKGFLSFAGGLLVVWGLGSFVLGVVNRK